MIMNDIDNIKIIRNIQKIKSKLDSLKFRDNEKDFILLIATHDYLKYIYNFLDSYYRNNSASNKIFIFTIHSKKFFKKNILPINPKYNVNHYEIIIKYKSAKDIKSISANIRFHLIDILMPYSKSILYLDSDSIILKDLKKMYLYFSNYSIVLRKHPNHRNGRSNHYYPLKSGFIYVKNNKLGREFVSHAIKDIKSNLQIWYADQKAISYAYFKISFSQIPKVLLFNSRYFDWNFYPEPYIFSAKGVKKNTLGFIYFSKKIGYSKNVFLKLFYYLFIEIETFIRNFFKGCTKIFNKLW